MFQINHAASRMLALLLLVCVGSPKVLAQEPSQGDFLWAEKTTPSAGAIQSLLIDPKNSKTLYVATEEGGIFKSTDNGESWFRVNTGFTDLFMRHIVSEPGSGVLYAGANESGIFKSNDAGASWNAASDGLVSGDIRLLTIDPTNVETLYTSTSEGLFISTNGAGQWSLIETDGLPQVVTAPPGALVTQLAINPQNSMELYAGSSFFEGLFKSEDGGATWVDTGATTTSVRSLVINPDDPMVIYASVFSIGGGNFLRSQDGGITWEDLSGFTPAFSSGPLIISPKTSQEIYLGTSSGVFKSEDGGATWSTHNNGLTEPSIGLMAIEPRNGHLLYALTNDVRLFRGLPTTLEGFDVTEETLDTLDETQLEVIDPLAFELFTEENIAALSNETFQGLSDEQLSNIMPQSLRGLSATQADNIPSESFMGLTDEQLEELPLDVIRGFTVDDVASFNTMAAQQSADRTISRLLTNLNPDEIQPGDVEELLPPGWEIDLTTGDLTAPPGAELVFRAIPAMSDQPENLELPPELPDLNSGFGLGGMSAQGTILENIDATLDEAGYEILDVMQTESGVISVSDNTGSTQGTLSLIPDISNAIQVDTSVTPPGLGVINGSQLVLTLPGGQQIPLIPVPQDPVELAGFFGEGVNIGEDGDVTLMQDDGTLLTVLFDAFAMPDSGLTPGLNLTNPNARNGSPIGIVVFGNGSAQQIYPYIPEPETFRETALALSPAIEAVTLNLLDGTATVVVNGSPLTLIPQSTQLVRTLEAGEESFPSILINPDLTLDYTVQENQDELLTNVAISP